MQIDNTIKPNDELYGNAKPPPLDYMAVQWRVDFFKSKVIENMKGDPSVLNEYVKHRDFWIEMRDKHCDVTRTKLCKIKTMFKCVINFLKRKLDEIRR